MALLFGSLLSASLLVSGGAAASSAATPSWQLIDNHQSTCYVSTRVGTNYYGIWISGSWKKRVNVGADSLPAGASYYTFYAPVPPGSSDGVGSLAYVAVVVPAGEPVGNYTSSLWASDGTSRQAVPITEVVKATSCRRY